MRFNNIYGDVFTIPEPYIPPTGARIMSLTSPENKMSKSDKDPGGCIYIMQSPDDIMRCFKRAVTDSPRPLRVCLPRKAGRNEPYADLQRLYG